MSIQSYPSKLLENAVDQFSRLPGIGRKTALRLVLHLLRQPGTDVDRFAQSVLSLRNEIKTCKHCNNISDTEECYICTNPRRNQSLLCVVESIRDVMSIENTGQYNGIYYILGGLISPMDGIGPADINIEGLVNKVSLGVVKEVVLALSATMEGDTTNFYIFKKTKHLPVEVTTIARGVAFGNELEYADEITLGRAIVNRVRFETLLSN